MWSLYGLRVALGLLQGVMVPAVNTAVNKWAPVAEKATFLAWTYIGTVLGTIVTYPLCGLIMAHASWTWVFYTSALMGLAWVAAWVGLMSDTPESDGLITAAERAYIVADRSFKADQLAADRATPLLPLCADMLRSSPVWACMVAEFCISVGFWALMTEGPDFINKILPLGTDIGANGLVSAAPHLAMTLYALLIGRACDAVVRRQGRKLISCSQVKSCGKEQI